jgi:hypothetical protein
MRRRIPYLAIEKLTLGRRPGRRYRPECTPLESRALLSTFAVRNLNDSGAGSLRAAISAAEAAPGGGTVTFARRLAGTINLGSPLEISGNLTIQGPGASAMALNGQYATQDLVVDAGATASISGLTVTGGFGTAGGGLLNQGNLALANMTFRNNDAGDGGPVPGDLPGTGGAIDNIAGATLTISSSQFTRNYAYNGQGGGAITNAGSLTLSTSTFTGNTVWYGGIANGPDGAALYNTATASVDLCTFTANSLNSVDSTGTLTLARSTITGDGIVGLVCSGTATIDSCTASGNGAGGGSSVYSDGGVFVSRGGMVTLVNCTLADNQGAGLMVMRGLTPTVRPTVVAIAECTIAGNTGTATSTDTAAAAGINVVGVGTSTQISLHNTILAGNTVVPSGGTALLHDLYSGTMPPQYISFGYNLIQAPGGVTFSGTTAGNIYGVDAKLGPLANNGGPTQTMALLAGSQAIDAGDPNLTGLPSTDQRGLPRLAHGRIDIGAFEVQ